MVDSLGTSCWSSALLLVLLYHHIAVKLVTDWYNLPDFSHGFLIPFFAAFLLWDKRRRDPPALQSSPAGPELSLVVLGLFELMVGVFGADLFLQRTSFVLLLAGLVWTLLGKAMLGRMKFVLFVLLLAIPLPTILFNQITFPLQMLASQLASDMLPLCSASRCCRRAISSSCRRCRWRLPRRAAAFDR